MKKSILLLMLCLMAVIMPGCRSAKTGSQAVKIEEKESSQWSNVNVPVRLDLIEPQKFSLSGRLTMVRDRYALISLRMLGFEVAQIYVSPDEADVVVKQMNKIWIQEPIASRLAKLKIPFSTLQEALLGNQQAFDSLPDGLNLTLGGSAEKPVLTLKISTKGKTLLGSMTLSMSEAQWDTPRPATFSAPNGSEYKKVALKDLGNILK
ncbi:MAG: DUF4292 domain-containing protein [Bacteroides sp.]|nr:DUF4292 domain-containing protein [Bacteroides sp.]